MIAFKQRPSSDNQRKLLLVGDVIWRSVYVSGLSETKPNWLHDEIGLVIAFKHKADGHYNGRYVCWAGR